MLGPRDGLGDGSLEDEGLGWRFCLRDEAGEGGGWNVSGLWRRAGFARREDGAGDEPFKSDWSARQVPSRPLPGRLLSSSDGGGVENMRMGVKRDARRRSQGSADGSNILREGRLWRWKNPVGDETSEGGGVFVCALRKRVVFFAPEGLSRSRERADGVKIRVSSEP